MNKLITNTMDLLEVSVIIFRLIALVVLIGTAGALQNDAIDSKTFIIRSIICLLVMFFA